MAAPEAGRKGCDLGLLVAVPSRTAPLLEPQERPQSDVVNPGTVRTWTETVMGWAANETLWLGLSRLSSDHTQLGWGKENFMLAKILIPTAPDADGGSFAYQVIDTLPVAGDVITFENGDSRLIEYVTQASGDPDGADVVMRVSAARLTVHQGTNAPL